MAGVPMTGGTAAPPASRQQARQQAARRAIKAPRGVAIQPAVKVPRVASSSPQKPSVTRAGKTAPPGIHARQGHPNAANTGGRGPVAFNPSTGSLTTQQLGQLANRITRQNMRTQLQPLRQQAREISGTEATVAKRYGGYANATDQLLQGVGQGAETQAKTFENQAADAALKAAQGINQTGQTAASEDGGYLDPQVQAELNAQGKLAAGTSSAQNTLAANEGQNETSFMANLRAAAAQRAIEGQHDIATQYGQQLAKNEGEQNTLRAKQPGEAKSLAVTLGQQQFTDQATAKELGIKNATLKQDAQKLNLTAHQDKESNRLKERGENITASKNAAEIRLGEQKLAETERHNRATETVAAEKARAEVKKANGGLTTTGQDKLSGELGTAYNIVQQMRSGKSKYTPQEIRDTLTTGSRRSEVEVETSTGKKYFKPVTFHYPKISDQTLITAAIELWYHHKVSQGTVQQLRSLGLNVPKEWTNGSFKGF